MKPRDEGPQMEMPTPCESCGRWQELNDMCPSEKWYPGIVICEQCSNLEEQEMQIDDEIEECRIMISDAETTIEIQTEELQKLMTKQIALENEIDEHRHQ